MIAEVEKRIERMPKPLELPEQEFDFADEDKEAKKPVQDKPIQPKASVTERIQKFISSGREKREMEERLKDVEKEDAETGCKEIPFYDKTLYATEVARLMTHQHHVDDSLADSVLASLVADDIYYFETLEMTGTPVVRFQNVDRSHRIFMDSMNEAVAETTGFYYNFSFDSYICYEVEGSQVKITTYTGPSGAKSVSYGRLGSVYSPKGERVRETSAYGRVRFDIKNIIDGSYITKTKDIYCTLEING